jgi:hypothetical protein
MEENVTTTAEEPAAKPGRGLKLPELDIPKPKRWDLIALVVMVVGVVLTGLNLFLARGVENGSISGAVTALFVTAQLAICLVGLMVLGKTAKEGTIWGNLFSVGACFVGMSGVLLASALWALA